MIFNEFKGLVSVVTGAGSGIGKAVAEAFYAAGANTVLVDINGESLEKVRNELENKALETRGDLFTVKVDLTKTDQVADMVKRVLAKYGKIDILVNNAGIVITGTIVDTNPADWERLFNTNVTSAYLTSHFILPHMLARKSGVIINMSSETGLKGIKERAAYSVTKAALIGLTKAMAIDHSRDGIRVNAVCPGTTETPLFLELVKKQEDPEKFRQEHIDRILTPYLGTPEEIARAVLYLASPESKYSTGTILTVDGGSTVI